MSGVLSFLFTLLITVPILCYFIVFVISKWLTKNQRKSIHHASDYSTLFFIFSVHFLILTIWGKSLLWIMVLLLLFIAAIFAVVHWKVKGEIIFTKVFKGFWRFNFLMFFIAYIALTFIGLLIRVTEYAELL